MKLQRISCVGANEKLAVGDCVDFLARNPRAELGVGVSKQKGGAGTARNKWLGELLDEHRGGRVPLHVNNDWSVGVANNRYPEELIDFLKTKPASKMQVNLGGCGYTSKDIEVKKFIASVVRADELGSRLILSYNPEFAAIIKNIYESVGDKFDVLYDASFGYGKRADKYESVFPNLVQGYAGGLSPDNIAEQLDKIASAQPSGRLVRVFIDAEGGLRSDNKNVIDLNKAEQFVYNAIEWERG